MFREYKDMISHRNSRIFSMKRSASTTLTTLEAPQNEQMPYEAALSSMQSNMNHTVQQSPLSSQSAHSNFRSAQSPSSSINN